MATRYQTPLDLNQYELRNPVFQNLGSDPGSPVNGQFWYLTTGGHDVRARVNGATVSLVPSSLLALANTWTSTNVFNGAVTGNNTINLTGVGTSSVGGTFSATVHIAAGITGAVAASRYVGATASGAPGSGTFITGDYIIDQTGTMWVCTAGGSPGTWKKTGDYLLAATNSWSASNTFTGGVVVNTTGITGNKEINLTGTGASSVGGTFSATVHTAVGITGAVAASRYAGATASGAPGSGTFLTGDFIVDQTGTIYVCTAGGSPGTWKRVGDYLLGLTNTWTASNTFTGGVVVNTTGITGNKEINLTGTGASSVAGNFTAVINVSTGLTGATAASRYVGATASGSPGSGTFATGDFVIAQNGHIFVCTAGGTPGTWADVAGSGAVSSVSGTSNQITVSPTTGAVVVSLPAAITTPGTLNTTGNLSENGNRVYSAGNLPSLSVFTAPTADVAWGSHKITGLLDPTSPQDAATKNYVDLRAFGFDTKDSVAAATTAVLPNSPTYANGTAGVGATLTAGSNVAFPSTLDGVATTVLGTRILVKDQASQLQNGIYTLTTVGSGATPWVLTRATDNDSSTSTPPRMQAGNLVLVDAGTVNGGQLWTMNQTAAITMGTTAITWAQISGASTTTAGAGLTATGNVFAVGAGTGVSVAADSIALDYTTHAATSGTGQSGATVQNATRQYTALVGNASLTTFTVPHNLGNQFVACQVFLVSTGAEEIVDILWVDANNLTLTFGAAPASNAYRVVITG